MKLEMVHDREATGVTGVIWAAAALWCGKQWENYFSWTAPSENGEKCYMSETGVGVGTSYIHLRRKEADWIGHILSWNWPLKHITEGKIEGTGRHMQLLDDLKETRKYWKMKDEAWGCTLWRNFFLRGNGPVVKDMMMISRNTRCKYEQ